ncbi:D-glycero-alpha-D-manno-heptose-1,7-bisphosphate 7-phosphatase [Metabacillus fastidiosus]|uniref:D-glycero-alpha-D-manno-heptose-1,7-bisphosphate 7-phosphatase n=1 Tax=Metabacillus fastidiosus TaxID=1458 RepID=UPI003D2E9CDD
MEKAIFLDRDGVINEVLTKRVKFVNNPKQFYLLDGAGEAINLMKNMGYKIFVVTNQGGVGLGFMKEEMLKLVHEKMKKKIAKFGGEIDDVIYCAHKPESGCSCRKPEPGMIMSLAEKHHISLSESYMIGDRDVDIIAGKKAGTKTILIGNEEGVADYEFKTLFEAAKWLGTVQ